MTSFKNLNPRIYQKSGPVITPDYVYWKKLGVRTTKHVILHFQQFPNITGARVA